MPTADPNLGCECSWTLNAEACDNGDNSYCWNACCLYPMPESTWQAYYDQLDPGRNTQEACDEALGVGLGIGLVGGLVFALVLLLGFSKTQGETAEVVVLQRRPAEATRLIWALGAASLIALLANLINGNYTCRKSGAYGLAAAAVTLAAAVASLLLDRFKPRVLHAEVARGATTLTRVAALSCAWWAAGAGVLTFYGPFKATSNGYFASPATVPYLRTRR